MKKILLTLLILSVLMGALALVSCDDQQSTTTTPEQPEGPVEHVHSFNEEVVAPTCKDNGYTKYVCSSSECDHYTYRDTFTDADAKYHVYEEEVVAPTCTKDGYTLYTCEICGDSYTDDIVPAEHTFTEENDGWNVTKVPTCAGLGAEYRECIYCDYTEEREIPASHHYDDGVVVDPTCLDYGYTRYTCTLCGHEYNETGARPINHFFGEWYVETPATCETKGVLRRDCENEGCEHFETEVIEKHPNVEQWHEDATCTAPGKDGYKCVDCGKEFIESYTEAHGHKYSDEWVDVPGMPGWKKAECIYGCGDAIYEKR